MKHRLIRKAAALGSAALLGLGLIGCGAVPDASADPVSSASAAQEASAESSATDSKKGHGNDHSSSAEAAVSAAASADVSANVPTTTDFSNTDRTDTWGLGTAEIQLRGDSASSSSSSVSIDGSDVIVTGAGSYVVSGTLNDGQIIVEAGDQDDVQLVLNGASVTCSDGPALHVKNADKVVLTLADGQENSMTDGTTYADTSDSAPDAAVYAEQDLSINGGGSLTVTASNNNGIATKDDLKIIDGNITVTAPNHALKGKDSVSIGGGTFVLEAGGDGIQSDQDSDPEKGWIVIDDGTFTITAGNDAIQSETGLTIHGGEFNVVTNGGSDNAAAKNKTDRFGSEQFGGADFSWPGGRPDDGTFGGFGDMPDDGAFGGFGAHGGRGRRDMQSSDQSSAAVQNSTTETVSAEPLRLSGEPSADAAQITESADPQASASADAPDRSERRRPDAESSATETDSDASASKTGPARPAAGSGSSSGSSGSGSTTSSDSHKGLKSSGNILVDGGTFDLNCADDAVHSDAAISLQSGTFRIASGDDAVHAEGDLISRADIEITTCTEGIEGLNISIEDGTIQLKSSDDGINAAGSGRASLTISGGTIVAECGGDGIDSNGDISVTGGEVCVLIQSSADNGAIDAEGTFTVTGGKLIYGGTGTGSGPQSGSSQSYVYASGSFGAGQAVSLRQNSQEVMSFVPGISCSSLIFTQPGIESGESYEVYAGDTLAATATAGQGGPGMMGGGMGGTRPGSPAADGTIPSGTTAGDVVSDRPQRPGTATEGAQFSDAAGAIAEDATSASRPPQRPSSGSDAAGSEARATETTETDSAA